MLKHWPAITRFYGFHPWDVDRFTLDELNEYVRQFNEHNRAQARAAAQAKAKSRRR